MNEQHRGLEFRSGKSTFGLDLAGLRFPKKDSLPSGLDFPIIHLHGWLDNAASFIPLSQHLPYELLSFDLPGHANSEHTAREGSYSLVDMARWVCEALDHMQIENYHIIAHSLGACVSTLIGAADPRVVSLTLLDAMGPLPQVAPTAIEGFIQYRQNKKHRRALERSIGAPFYRKTQEEAIFSRTQGTDLRTEDAALMAERGLIHDKGHGFYWNFDRKLQLPSLQRFSEDQIIKIIEHITPPTMVITSQVEAFAKPDQIEKFKNAHKNSTCHRLESGHHLHMEKPKEVADLWAEFIEDLRKNGGYEKVQPA